MLYAKILLLFTLLIITARESIAKTAPSGSLACVQRTEHIFADNVKCELLTVDTFADQYIVSINNNDKSVILFYAKEAMSGKENKRLIAVTKELIIDRNIKLNHIGSISVSGNTIFLVGAYDSFFDKDKGLWIYPESSHIWMLTIDPQAMEIKEAQVIADENMRNTIIQTLAKSRHESAPLFFTIKASTIIQREDGSYSLLLGVQSQGPDSEQATNEVIILEVPLSIGENDDVKLANEASVVYDGSANFTNFAISGLQYDMKMKILYMTVIDKTSEYLKGAVYKQFLPELELKQNFTKILNIEGHEPKGIAELSENELLVICDDGYNRSPMGENVLNRDLRESPFFIINNSTEAIPNS